MGYHASRTVGRPDAPLVLTFHGTGGDEHQFHGFAREVMPGAHVVSPRGDVSEGGALRFFRRTGEGVYDMKDLAVRTEAVARFVRAERSRTGATRVVGIGYSNGANILASVVMSDPVLFTDAALMHPLIPWRPEPRDLTGLRAIVTAGERDPICPAGMTQEFVRWLGDSGATVTTSWHRGGHEIRPEELAAVSEFLS